MVKRGYLVIMFIVIILSGCTQEAQETPVTEQIVEEPETPIIEPEVEESAVAEVPAEEPVVEEEPEVTEPVDPNLIAHWKFDDDAKDSAKSHNGTIKGNAIFKTGKIGKALYFDGVNDYVDIPSFKDIGGLTKGTIAFWFDYESLLDTQTLMPIFYIGMDNEKDEDNLFIIEIGHFDDSYITSKDAPPELSPSNKKLYVTWVKDNLEPYLCYDSNVNLAENKWHHFAVVVDENGNTGYLNGVEITNRHYNFGKSSDKSFLDDVSNKEKLMLGYGRSSHQVWPDFVYYKGSLDDFRIYDKALTADEIKELAE